MKQNLRKTILAVMGTAALAGLSTEASAFDEHDFGVLSGKDKAVFDGEVPFKSYTDFMALNQGWVYVAKFHIFTLGTPEEIAAGARYDVTITMKGNGPNVPLDNPAFSVFAMGSNTYRKVNLSFHGWAQLRGPNDNVLNPLSKKPGTLPGGEVVIANNVDHGDTAGIGDGEWDPPTPNGIPDGGLLAAGVVDGHDGWVGYAQSGPSVTVRYDKDPLNDDPQTKNGTVVTDEMPYGWYVNRNSPFVDGKRSRGKVTSGRPLDLAKLTLRNLKAGNYLIGSGGSCGTAEPAVTCIQGRSYRMTIATKPK